MIGLMYIRTPSFPNLIFPLVMQDDFKNYGIKIRVKYRSAEPLLDLSANHHSGSYYICMNGSFNQIAWE